MARKVLECITNKNNMDSDSCKQENTEGEKPETGDPLPNAWNVFQPFWLRYSRKANMGFDRLVLDYNGYFLPCCGLIFWTLFLLLKT